MEFRTYKNRIVLVDDEEQALAEIDFPAMEEEPGTVEITHTYVDESLRGRGLAGKLMTRLITYLERNQLKAWPSCSYAVDWFAKHSEAAHLLSPSYMPASTAQQPVPDMPELTHPSTSTGSTLNATTITIPAADTASSTAGMTSSGSTRPSTPHAASDFAAEPSTGRPGSVRNRHANPRPVHDETEEDAYFRNTEYGDEEKDAYFRDTEYGNEEEDGPVDGGIRDRMLMGVNRVLQLFSVAALILLYLLMVVPALENLNALGPIESMITDHNVAEITFISVFVGITLFSLISLFWMLSRKKYVRYGTLETIDTGRGMTAFILLLLVEVIALLLSPITESAQPVIVGLAIASTRLVVNRAMIFMAGGVGLVLSVIRKIIRH